MTPDEQTDLAFAVARYLGRRWRRDPAELVGVVWERLGVARAKGWLPAGATRALLFRAGVNGAVDGLRAEGGKVGTRRHRLARRTVSLGAVAARRAEPTRWRRPPAGDLVAPPASADPAARMLEFWGDTRPLRAGWPRRHRVLLYLYAVEGLTLREAGAVFGITQSGAAWVVARFRLAVASSAPAPDRPAAGALRIR